jgi:hypothetical protein
VAPSLTPYLIPPVGQGSKAPNALPPSQYPIPIPTYTHFRSPERTHTHTIPRSTTLARYAPLFALCIPGLSPKIQTTTPWSQISHRKLLRTKVQIEAAPSAAKELLSIVGGRCNPSHFMRAPARRVLSQFRILSSESTKRHFGRIAHVHGHYTAIQVIRLSRRSRSMSCVFS